ncbi:MAG TPA: glycosyltransferase [Thermoanaerobaculia bacterium]|nr:glycosyltransferase [Thermoanaerobaculia bacterium]
MLIQRSILVYCGDVVGLGHQRRNLAIASRLVQEMPELDVLMLTSQPAGFLGCPERVDVVKLPSLTKDPEGALGPRTLSLQHDQLSRLRRRIIEGVASTLRPDLVLVDHHPTGLWGELGPSLRSWRKDRRGPCVVLGVRDILDDPTLTVQSWRRDGVYRAISQSYDAVLIYGAEEVFDTKDQYRLQEETGVPAHYCGYVCSENGDGDEGAARHGLGLTARQVVVATAGGGGDGYPMMRLCLEALRRIAPSTDLELVCITGPLMRRDEIEDLRRRAADLPARIVWCVDHLPSYLQAADVLLTMAGYNSMLEAMRLRKPTIVLPRTGPSAEQGLRAARLAERGIVHALGQGERTPDHLARVIEQALASPPPDAILPPMNGVDQAARCLRGLLDERATRLADAPWSLRPAVRQVV